MNPRDRKRHEQRKARRRAIEQGDIEPELRGTRMGVFPLDDGSQVRRLEIDATDPIEVVVRWGRRAFLEAAPPRVIRVVTIGNWNDDPRELYEIEECRAYLRRLWEEGKPLLRLLTESTADCPDDDRLGLPPAVLRGLGWGWHEVYAFGFCDVEREGDVIEEDGGPSWVVAIRGLDQAKRGALRAELLGITPENPEGYSYSGARDRAAFSRAHSAAVRAHAAEIGSGEDRDEVVIVLDLLDHIGREIAVAIGGAAAIREQLARCQADDLWPGAVIAAPRGDTVQLLETFAPESAQAISSPAPAGGVWAVTLAAGGSVVGLVSLTDEEDVS
jgi:hypothetical protein